MITFIANSFQFLFSLFLLGAIVGLVGMAFFIPAFYPLERIAYIVVMLGGGFFFITVFFGFFAIILDIRKCLREMLALLKEQ